MGSNLNLILDSLVLKNKKVKKLVNIHLLISFIISSIGSFILWIFNTYFISYYLIDAGIIIFRTGLLLGVFSIMYGIFFEKYLKCE